METMGKKVLVVEDDGMLRDLLVRHFKASFTVLAAEDGEQALALAKQNYPDIILLDLLLPKVDGFQVLEQLPKEQRKYPVVILTNFADEKSRERGRELSVDDYFIKKDMTIKSLLEMVERVHEQWKRLHP